MQKNATKTNRNSTSMPAMSSRGLVSTAWNVMAVTSKPNSHTLSAYKAERKIAKSLSQWELNYY